MKIMILGNNSNVSTLIKKLACENSVSKLYVTMQKKYDSDKVVLISDEIQDVDEFINFAKENEVTYTIILDEELLALDASRKFAMAELLVFSSDSDSFRVCNSKSIVKKLAYKLKIPTPKFGVYDKEYQAIAAIRDFRFPFVVKADEGDFYEICETYSQAKKVIQNLFFHDFKKVVIEQYVEGEYFSFYVVSDGYDVIPFGAVYSYVNPNDINDVVTVFPYNKIDNEIETQIAREFIFPIIDEFNLNENVFLGVFGLDLIITKEKKLYLIGLNNFFKKYDAQTVLNAVDMELSKVFLAASMFSLREKYDFISFKDRFFSSFKIKNTKVDDDLVCEDCKDDKIVCVSAPTINMLNERITELYEE